MKAGAAAGRRETLEIPESVREEVDARDLGFCRCCGEFLGFDRRVHHHIWYGADVAGMGGRRIHEPSNIITLGWAFSKVDCHGRVHAHKQRYQQALSDIASRDDLGGITAFQLLRFSGDRQGNVALTLDQVRERFYAKLKIDRGCLMWTGDPGPDGYGQVTARVLSDLRGLPPGQPHRAHHVAWFFAIDRWPEAHLLHSCDRPGCCNVEHLREGTHAENMADRKERRPRHGTANPAARLSDEDVAVIREGQALGISLKVLADEHGVSVATVRRVVSGETYQSGTATSRPSRLTLVSTSAASRAVSPPRQASVSGRLATSRPSDGTAGVAAP